MAWSNLVVKRPEGRLRSARIEARQDGGSAAAVDLSERFGDASQFGVRFNAAYEHLDPLVRNARGYRHLAALAADCALGPRHLLEVEFESSRQQQPSVPGFSLLGNAVPDANTIDPRINLNNQAWSQPVVLQGNTASLRVTHTLAGDWRARLHAMTQRLSSDDRIAFPFGCSAEGNFDRYCSDGSFDFYDFRSDGEKRRSDALDVGIEGRLAAGGVTHHLSAGVLATRHVATLPPQAFNYAGTGHIDGTVAAPEAPLPLFDMPGRNERSTELYVRDRVELAPRWSLWAGLRHTRLRREAAQSFTTPWLALTWQAQPHTLLYANWGQGVESEAAPNLPLYSNAGRALPALKSRQLEAGLKHARNGLNYSLAAFAITRPHAGDFGACDGSDGSCTRAIDGEAVHRGVEAQIGTQVGALELAGQRPGPAGAPPRCRRRGLERPGPGQRARAQPAPARGLRTRRRRRAAGHAEPRRRTRRAARPQRQHPGLDAARCGPEVAAARARRVAHLARRHRQRGRHAGLEGSALPVRPRLPVPAATAHAARVAAGRALRPAPSPL